MQLFGALNSPRRATFGIRFAKSYHQVLASNVDTRDEQMVIQPYHTLMFMYKDFANQVDSFSENLKLFAQGCRSDMTFQQFADENNMKLEEVILYARHFIYYKKGILIHRLDRFSYFMLRGEQSVSRIMLADDHKTRDAEYLEGARICEFLSTHRSGAEILKYVDPSGPGDNWQKLDSKLFQLLVKRTAYEVLMYLLPTDSLLSDQPQELEPTLGADLSHLHPIARTTSQGALPKVSIEEPVPPSPPKLKHAATMREEVDRPGEAHGAHSHQTQHHPLCSKLEVRVLQACQEGKSVKEMLFFGILEPDQVDCLVKSGRFKPFFKF